MNYVKMLFHSRNKSSLNQTQRIISKTRTVSAATRAQGRLHLFNKQLPKFAQVNMNDIKEIYSKQELEVTISVPLVSHKLKRLVGSNKAN